MLDLRVIGVDSFQCIGVDKPGNHEMLVRIPIERRGPEGFKIKNLHQSPGRPTVECYLPHSASVNEEKRGGNCSFVCGDSSLVFRPRPGAPAAGQQALRSRRTRKMPSFSCEARSEKLNRTASLSAR